MGIPGAGPHRTLSDIGQLGLAVSPHAQMVSGTQVSVDISTNRHDIRYGRADLLCIFTNETKLPHRTLDLAHADGVEHSMPVAEPKVLSAEMLAHT